MRLLHTTELRFEEFLDDALPDYAILSHRWFAPNEEVSYQEFLTGRNRSSAGYVKVVACCNVAAADTSSYRHKNRLIRRFEWVWIDTCCIDKTSSAELSEAINSMYRWYANCVVCYAYLSDVADVNDLSQLRRSFELSQWFGRGWTLQELLAPPRLVFFNKDWVSIGTRDDLASHISTATGISQTFVTNFGEYSTTTAEKFSWIATRTTSRPEDLAYSLMGLFDINMPLLYGEGGKAFRRLQLEILRSSNDESVFMWDTPVGWPWARNRAPCSGILATVTYDFAPLIYHRHPDNQDTDIRARIVPGVSRPPYTITNQGLELRVPKKLAQKLEFFLPLNYRSFRENAVTGVYAILLARGILGRSGVWQRYFPASLPVTLPKLPVVEYTKYGHSRGLFIAPESWLWSREQLAAMETEVIYVEL